MNSRVAGLPSGGAWPAGCGLQARGQPRDEPASGSEPSHSVEVGVGDGDGVMETPECVLWPSLPAHSLTLPG